VLVVVCLVEKWFNDWFFCGVKIFQKGIEIFKFICYNYITMGDIMGKFQIYWAFLPTFCHPL
jgi:hypothetical protein